MQNLGGDTYVTVGTVKWFNPEKGYGFITQKNGLPDVLIHITELQVAGLQDINDGATVSVEVCKSKAGLKASKILNVDDTTSCARTPRKIVPRTHTQVVTESAWERVIVKWFNTYKGYGFVQMNEDSDDIFIHMATVREFGFQALCASQRLEVRWGTGPKGKMVSEMRPCQN